MLKIAILGAGWWAVTNHLPRLRANPQVSIVSVSGTDPAALRRIADKFDIAHCDADWRESLAREVDAVVVSTPNHLHYVQAAAALDRGLHVLCEKPMTLDAAQGWDLARRARAAGRHLLVPYGWNYKLFVEAAKRQLDDGLIGEIHYVLCHMASPTRDLFAGAGGVPSQWAPELVAPNPATWQDASLGGGYAHCQITHSAALMFWLTGLRAREVSARMSAPGAEVDLFCAASVVFENGALGAISGAATLPDGSKYQIDLRVFGSKGTLLLDVERERAEFRLNDGRVIAPEIAPDEGAYSCEGPVDRFLALISGAETPNNSDAELGAKAVELVVGCHRSAARHGERVFVTNPSTS
jgi:predicted dehydrogenase